MWDIFTFVTTRISSIQLHDTQYSSKINIFIFIYQSKNNLVPFKHHLKYCFYVVCVCIKNYVH